MHKVEWKNAHSETRIIAHWPTHLLTTCLSHNQRSDTCGYSIDVHGQRSISKLEYQSVRGLNVSDWLLIINSCKN